MSKTSRNFKVSNPRNTTPKPLPSQSSCAAEAVVDQCENDDETIWMMQDEDEDVHHGDDNHEVHEGVFLMNDDHSHRPLHQVDQTMRDQILRSLVTAHVDCARERSPLRHGPQEGERASTSDREVRLEQDRGATSR